MIERPRVQGEVCPKCHPQEQCVESAQLQLTLENDLNLVAPLVLELEQMMADFLGADQRNKTRYAIAVEEALTNAILHGNLEIPPEVRCDENGGLEKEIAHRRGSRPYNERQVYVRANFSCEEAVVEIRDDGRGFDYDNLPDPTALENLEKPHGRGVMLIRTYMDEVRYIDRGNHVVLVKRR